MRLSWEKADADISNKPEIEATMMAIFVFMFFDY